MSTKFRQKIGRFPYVGGSEVSIHGAFTLDPKSRGRFLFVSPHDDDAAIGAGMIIMDALKHNIDVYIAIVTDGRMGYESEVERDGIVERRRQETVRAYLELGVPEKNIHFLGFPDADTWSYIGRRPAREGDPEIAGFTGMTNSLTWIMRKVAPHTVFVACSRDFHPDHQSVNMVTLMCVGHAASGIWQELGDPCEIEALYEYAVYRRPKKGPEIGFFGDSTDCDNKMRVIGVWESQATIIREIVGRQKDGGACEFLWRVDRSIYNPRETADLFSK